MTKDEEDKLFAAFTDVIKEARQEGRNYRDAIASGSITGMSATLVVIGFLVNSHRERLLVHPHSTIWTLYITWGGFGLAYILSIYMIKLRARYIGEHGERFRSTMLNDKDKAARNEQRSGEAAKMSKIFGIASEVAAAVGVVGFVSFAVVLLRNITRGI